MGRDLDSMPDRLASLRRLADEGRRGPDDPPRFRLSAALAVPVPVAVLCGLVRLCLRDDAPEFLVMLVAGIAASLAATAILVRRDRERLRETLLLLFGFVLLALLMGGLVAMLASAAS